jgi:VanZ family protein
MTFLLKLTHSKFRGILPIPMIAQMSMMVYMALFGRPAVQTIAPDWVMHIAAYYILFVLSWIGCHGISPRSRLDDHRLSALVIAICFAFIDEGLQFLVSVRHGELLDVIADAFGALLAFLFITIITHNNPDA